jgi:hypothetical protein
MGKEILEQNNYKQADIACCLTCPSCDALPYGDGFICELASEAVDETWICDRYGEI